MKNNVRQVLSFDGSRFALTHHGLSTMDIKDFDYLLPEDLIAQYPLPQRDSSRLMVLERASGVISHLCFQDITTLLRSGDVLVLNDTRVVPARVGGHKDTGGKVELLLIRQARPGVWECMIKNSKGLRPGSVIRFDGGGQARVEGAADNIWSCVFASVDPWELMDAQGCVPLPPYIRRKPDAVDKARYQTVFAGQRGAVAAPTAGLHFTDELLSRIRDMGVEVCCLTLHTGPGTFLPVRVIDVRTHRMHTEFYSIPAEVFGAVVRAKAQGRRVIAVGTTTARALEAAVRGGHDRPVLEGSTDIFIYPGFVFKVIDGLLTNFHLPRSTLLMLVAAFTGRERVLTAYKEAVEKRYRFFSYGDAMFIA